MNNLELEKKIKEIIEEDNFFNMIEKAYIFDKEYKTSNFYKLTKMPITDVIKSAKQFYLVDVKTLTNKLQSVINGLTLDNLFSLADKFSNVLEQDNINVMNQIKELDLDNFFKEGRRISEETNLDEDDNKNIQ